MTRDIVRFAIIFVVVVVALSGAAAVQGAAAQDNGTETADNETAENGPAVDAEALEVTSLTAPESVEPGSDIAIAAVVQNPTDAPLVENVEYRFAGQIVDSQLVAVQPGDAVVVQFEANTSGFETGDNYHAVFAQQDGQVAPITLSESFTLEPVDDPANVTEGEETSIDVEVSNPNDFETQQTVTLRQQGQLFDRQAISIGANESETVAFDLDTEDLPPGTYVYSALTRDDGQFFQVTVEELPEEEPETPTPTPEEPETPTPEPETPTPTPEEPETPTPEEETETPTPEPETPTPEPETPTPEPETPTPEPETPTPEPETPTPEPETPTPEPETPTPTPEEPETPTAEPDEEPTASVVFPTYNETSVTVNQANLSDGGFIAIHNQTEDGEVGPTIGVSEHLEPGTHENVVVHLFDVPGANFSQMELTESQTLIAMPHLDTNDNQTYDFVATNGTEDVPYTEDGVPVTDEAYIHIEDVEEPVETPTPEPETPTPTPEEPETPTPTPEEPETPTPEPEEPETPTPEEEPETPTPDEPETPTPTPEEETETPTPEEETPTPEPETPTPEEETPEEAVEDPELNTSVQFDGMAGDGTTVTVEQVNLSDGGFLVIYDEGLFDAELLAEDTADDNVTVDENGETDDNVTVDENGETDDNVTADENETVDQQALDSVIGVSEYLEPGSHENVTVELFNVTDVEFDRDRLEESQTVIAVPHQDTNDNQTFDFIATNGTEDGPYTEDGEVITEPGFYAVDEEGVTEETPEPVEETPEETPEEETPEEEPEAEASLEFEGGVSDGTNVTIEQANLSDGGFVAIHNETLFEEGTVDNDSIGDERIDNETIHDAAVDSVIGVSEYLEPGSHENVTVELFNVTGVDFEQDRLEETQPVVAMPHRDTNDNQTFDFVATNASEDGPYMIDGYAIVEPALIIIEDDEEVEETPTPDEEVEDADVVNETEVENALVSGT